MEFWMDDKYVSSHRALHGYVLWGIWLTKSKMTFEDKKAQLGRLSHHIRVSYGEGRRQLKNNVPRSLQE